MNYLYSIADSRNIGTTEFARLVEHLIIDIRGTVAEKAVQKVRRRCHHYLAVGHDAKGWHAAPAESIGDLNQSWYFNGIAKTVVDGSDAFTSGGIWQDAEDLEASDSVGSMGSAVSPGGGISYDVAPPDGELYAGPALPVGP